MTCTAVLSAVLLAGLDYKSLSERDGYSDVGDFAEGARRSQGRKM